MINNNSSKNEEIAKKPLIKKEGMKKTNLLNSKKNYSIKILHLLL